MLNWIELNCLKTIPESRKCNCVYLLLKYYYTQQVTDAFWNFLPFYKCSSINWCKCVCVCALCMHWNLWTVGKNRNISDNCLKCKRMYISNNCNCNRLATTTTTTMRIVKMCCVRQPLSCGLGSTWMYLCLFAQMSEFAGIPHSFHFYSVHPLSFHCIIASVYFAFYTVIIIIMFNGRAIINCLL